MKSILVLFLVLMWVADLFAQESDYSFSVYTDLTYGRYVDSKQRSSIISESIALAYRPSLSGGLGLVFHRSNVSQKKRPNITGLNTNLSYDHFFINGTGNYIRGKGVLHRISNDDPNSNSNGAIIPHLSLSYHPEDLLSVFEIGFARSPYLDTTAQQISLMGALALFDDEIWSQTRVYVIDLSNPVQRKRQTLAFEERLYYYVIPDELTLSLYALFGERIYAYDIDLGTAYNVPDTQKGSFGLSLHYTLEDVMSIFTDFTQEQYFNVDIGDAYLVRYITFGVSTQF